jgi:hypothetical protein
MEGTMLNRTPLLFALGLATSAAHASIVSMVGDEDAFGLRPNGTFVADGTLFSSDLGGEFERNYQKPGDPWFTDYVTVVKSPTYAHAYTLDGTARTATLALRFVGIADNGFGPYFVTFNGTRVGTITQDTSRLASIKVRNFAFNVPVGLLTGNDTVNVSVNPTTTGNADTFGMDFSRLSIVTQAVPEPATIAVLGLGLVALRRRRR